MTVTVGDVVKELKRPVQHAETTVDMLETGNADAIVQGIATAFMPTHEVIKQAAAQELNLLVAHEGLYYSHERHEKMLWNDPVSAEKRKLLEDSGLAVFRCHDSIHRQQPDGITKGLLQQLDWEPFVTENQPAASFLRLPPISLAEMAQYIKETLGIPSLRIVGDPSHTFERVGVSVGYRGKGADTIPFFHNKEVDLFIIGEGPEWETPEYVRDAVQQGKQKALIVLGHAESEVPGMKFLASQLQDKYPAIPVQFISEKQIFQLV